MITLREFTNRPGMTFNPDKTFILFAEDLHDIKNNFSEIEDQFKSLNIDNPVLSETDIVPNGPTVAKFKNGSADDFDSTIELTHTYKPSQAFDVWNFLIKTGYDFLSYPRLIASFSFGSFYGLLRFALKGFGLYFADSDVDIVQSSFPTSKSLAVKLRNTLGSFYVDESDQENSFAFNKSEGFVVKGNYYSVPIFQANPDLGGTIHRPKHYSNIVSRDIGNPSQEGHLHSFENYGGTVLSFVHNNGAFGLPSIADSAVANNSLYFSTDRDKLCFKDIYGTINELYS